MKKNFFFFDRPYWRCYYSNTDAIIYVVDSVDKDRIGISKQELIAMLEVRLLYLLTGCKINPSGHIMLEMNHL